MRGLQEIKLRTRKTKTDEMRRGGIHSRKRTSLYRDSGGRQGDH